MTKTILASIEERLFALRSLARKHKVSADSLHLVHDELVKRLSVLEEKSVDLTTLERRKNETWRLYQTAVLRLRAMRCEGSTTLDERVKQELVPLKLEKARFETRVEPLEENDWGAYGGDRIVFMVSLNPDFALGALNKVASGGERSRLMLALRVVISGSSCVPTLIFDEIDRGLGGSRCFGCWTTHAQADRILTSHSCDAFTTSCVFSDPSLSSC